MFPSCQAEHKQKSVQSVPLRMTNVQFQITESLWKIELPECPALALQAVVEEYQVLFHTIPGVTEAACHYIPTTGNPV